MGPYLSLQVRLGRHVVIIEGVWCAEAQNCTLSTFGMPLSNLGRAKSPCEMHADAAAGVEPPLSLPPFFLTCSRSLLPVTVPRIEEKCM